MRDSKLKVVIGAPQGVWNALGDQACQQILCAHPKVHVEEATEEEQFSKLAL